MTDYRIEGRPTLDPSYLCALQAVRRALEDVSDRLTVEIRETLDAIEAEQESSQALEDDTDTEDGAGGDDGQK